MEVTGGMIIGTTITIITVPAPVLPSAQIVRIAPTAPIVRDRPGRRTDLPGDNRFYPPKNFKYRMSFSVYCPPSRRPF
jgi:hypothetical protein